MQLYRFNGQSVLHLFVMLLMLIGPLSTTFINKPVVVILFCAALMCVFFSLILQKPLRIWHIAAWPSGCYLALMLWALFAIILSRDVLTGTYLSEVIIGRLFTLVTAVLSLFIINWWLTSATEKQLKQALWTAFTILLIFILLGIWQFIGNVLGIKFFIATRDWMHGVPDSLKAILPKRLTSIAEEPNFLSPLIFEFCILLLVLIKNKFISFPLLSVAFFVMVFSLSGGAYANFLLLIFCYWIISLIFNLKKGVFSYFDLFFIVLLTIFFVVIVTWGQPLIEFSYYKLQTEASGNSYRSQFFSSVFALFYNSNFQNVLLGHGLATMSVLNEFGMPIEQQLFKITNNFFLDMLWETGILGVGIILLMFTLLSLPGFKFYRRNKFFVAGLFLTIHFFVTALYRSEYLSTHFIFVFSLIFIFYRLAAVNDSNRKLND